MVFNYHEAFSRNLGWITPAELEILRSKRIAIAGLGGVGGIHLLTLVRLGIGRFNLAEFDRFELANFNRQVGASMSTLGQAKLEVMVQKALDINPELELQLFPEGLTANNVDAFLADVDLYVDGLDFFAFKARETVFGKCTELQIPAAVTAAPLGLGTSFLAFLPGKMTFEEYFRLAGQSEQEKAMRFLIGLTPRILHKDYLVAPEFVDLAAHRGPSTSAACELCAGILAAQSLKILLKRGKVCQAPHSLQFDAYLNKLVHSWRPWGNNNPLQKLILRQLRKNLLKKADLPPPPMPTPQSPLERILELARWAPSGDNVQPWRFEILGENSLSVHIYPSKTDGVYDLDSHSLHVSLGSLLETLHIAASQEKKVIAAWKFKTLPNERALIEIAFAEQLQSQPSPLVPYIAYRTVNRRALKRRKLTASEKNTLAQSLDANYQILWIEETSAKMRMAQLCGRVSHIRLTMPEAYTTHKQIIDWNSRYSISKIPDQSLGIDRLSLKLMRWCLTSWERVKFLNRYLMGTLLPRTEMDYLPGFFCAGFFVITASKEPETAEDFVQLGRNIQRFWLTATKLGLQMNPVYAIPLFFRYLRHGIAFTKDEKVKKLTEKLELDFEKLYGKENAEKCVFIGRIGEGPPASSRALRFPLNDLIEGTANKYDHAVN